VASAKTFDMRVELSHGVDHTFQSISREELDNLNHFFAERKLRVKNELTEEAMGIKASVDELLGDDDDEDESGNRRRDYDDDDDEAQNDVHPLDWVSHLAQGELDDQQHGHAKSVSHDTSRSTTSFPHHSCDGGDDARNQSEVPEAFMHLAKMYPGKHAHSEDGLNDD